MWLDYPKAVLKQSDGSNSFSRYSIDCVEVPRSSLLMYIDCVYCILFRDVNKDLTLKDQDNDKDLTPKDQDKDKDLTPKDKDKDLLDLTPQGQGPDPQGPGQGQGLEICP